MRRLTIILAAAIIFSCTDRTTSDGIRVIDADLTGKEVIELKEHYRRHQGSCLHGQWRIHHRLNHRK